MSTVLDQTSALKGLASLWEEHAEVQRRYNRDDPKAQTLARCAEDVRRILGETTPEWVPIRTVHATTGQSLTTLRRRCEELVHLGQARKGPGGRWVMALAAALDVPVRSDRLQIDGKQDLHQLARILGRDPG